MKRDLRVHLPFTLAVGIVIVLCASRVGAADYYSLQNTNWPPLPFLPLDVPVYDLGDGIFAYDDLGREEMMESAPPPPGEGGGGTNEVANGPLAYCCYTTNDLWVEVVLVTNGTVALIIHAPNTNTYDLYRTFELIGSGHVGEYNGVSADEEHVFLTWTDYRLPSNETIYGRNQSDVRLVRLAWP